MLQFQTLYYRKVILDKLYPPLVLLARTTFHEVTHPPALFESPRDKYTIFVVSRIHPQAEALRRILKTKWCICPWSIQNRAGTLSSTILGHSAKKLKIGTTLADFLDLHLWQIPFLECLPKW
jgi:hypothetical protein